MRSRGGANNRQGADFLVPALCDADMNARIAVDYRCASTVPGVGILAAALGKGTLGAPKSEDIRWRISNGRVARIGVTAVAPTRSSSRFWSRAHAKLGVARRCRE